ncbi:amino acid permease [Vibrio sp. SM6]|uniref:Amino acid permease n=1 Tax=Vibrio agarilyticus TaxID=2726741 RepID=A0A7X8YHF1_9VIBR|nr:APC family permease [Vibrio agarilyticus]NLS13406.1 amino acid permease [Vibrio agarilyticus]
MSSEKGPSENGSSNSSSPHSRTNVARSKLQHAFHRKPHSMNVWSVAALGIGSMVGAGVFALLGQIAFNVGGNAWIIFIIAGIAALFSGYAYSRMSAQFPSRGGVIDFFMIGVPFSKLARSLSTLYLITLILTIAMVCKAFGAYSARFINESGQPFWIDVFASLSLVGLLLVNLLGAKVVGRVETTLVGIKLIILAIFIVAGVMTLDIGKLENHPPLRANAIFSSVGLAFFAYAGFGMMANASEDIDKPSVSMPRAFMLAIGSVMALYIILSLVVLGNVTPRELLLYADTAVAQAAKPVLGNFGFTLVLMAALFATASATMANLFSALNVSNSMGESHVLPKIFSPKTPTSSTIGFYILMIFVLLLINLFDLSVIANIASAGFLACYLGVFFACWNKRHECDANPTALIIGFVLMLIIFTTFIAELVLTKQWDQCLILLVAFIVSAGFGWREPTSDIPK